MKKTGLKWFAVLAAALMGAVVFTGCGQAKLADSFDEEEVKAAAEEIVSDLSDEDFDSVYDMLREDLREQLTTSALKEAMDTYFPERGAFQEIKSMAVVGQKIADTQEDSAVAVAVAEYENQKITYTISFDTDMEIIGLYMK